mmetsp:Transcript_9219/g.13430  ORF Transcript_9219/g.13430 Transcript_9219/m.13430 type:complete len:88 (+) Transcript_9219:1984-2247(+)
MVLIRQGRGEVTVPTKILLLIADKSIGIGPCRNRSSSNGVPGINSNSSHATPLRRHMRRQSAPQNSEKAMKPGPARFVVAEQNREKN